MKKLLIILLVISQGSMLPCRAVAQTFSNTFFYGRDASMIYSVEMTAYDYSPGRSDTAGNSTPLTYVLTVDAMKSIPDYSVNMFNGHDLFNRIVFYHLTRGSRNGYFTLQVSYNIRAAQYPTMIGVDSTRGYFQCKSAQSSLPAGGGPYTWKVYYDTL